ncbi:MAG: multiheme c-type cytochrome ExtKL, partial [Thermodesulfovibrionales bacterium]
PVTKEAKMIAQLALLVVLMIVPSMSYGEKARSIDELVKRYDSSSCKQCHTEIHTQWERSHHHKTLIGTKGRTASTWAAYLTLALPEDKVLKQSGVRDMKDVKFRHMKPCTICHLPQLEDATDEVANEVATAIVNNDLNVLEKLSINCIICHNMRAIVRHFRDGNPEKGVIYGPRGIGAHGDKGFPVAKKSNIMTDPAFCGQCHSGPNLIGFDEPMYCVSNFDSYLHAYVPLGKTETCQDCHMRGENLGHSFPPVYDDEKLTIERLKKWIDLEVSTLGYEFRPTVQMLVPEVVIKTKVTSRIGHRYPDGCPSPNRVTLDVLVRDAGGKELFRDQKIYMPQSGNGYSQVMVYGAFAKLGLLRDTSLQPFMPAQETFEIRLPEEVRNVLVEVRLVFRHLPGDEVVIHKVTKTVSLDR